jgi:TonB-dependent receptor
MSIHIEKAAAGRLAMSALLAGTLVITAPVAFAQQETADGTADQSVEEIVVTGYRESLRSARDIKKNAKGVVDVIVAEDIGKMPDENVAEALQRIPGLAITRDNGEGSEVSIRGIMPNLNRISVNGKTLTSSGDDQGVGFETFSSGLLDKVEVIKSPSANMVEGSIGATVLLKTKMPLDMKDRKLVVAAQSEYNEMSDHYDPKASVTYYDQFADGRFGIAASLNYEERFLRQDGIDVFQWTMPVSVTGDQRGRINTGYRDADGNRLYDAATQTLLCSETTGECHPDRILPDGTDLGPYGAHDMRAPNHRLFLDERERVGGNLTLDFKPSDTTRLVFDMTVSQYDVYRERYQYSTGFQNTRVDPDSIVMGPNNTIVRAVHIACNGGDLSCGEGGTLRGNRLPGNTSNNVWMWQENKSAIYGLQFEKDLGRLRMTAGVGYTDTTRRTPEQYRMSYNTGNNDRLPMFYDLTLSDVPVWGVYTDVPDGVALPNGGDLMLPDIYSLNAVTSFTDVTDDDELELQLDFEVDIDKGPFTTVYWGVRSTEREKDRNADAPRFTANAAGSIGDFSITLGTPGVLQEFPYNDWASDISGDLIRSWPLADLDGGLEAFGVTREQLQGDPISDPDPIKSYVITEDTFAAYLMADYEFADGRVIGDIGLRMVETKNVSAGFFDAGDGAEAGVFPKNYTEVLPSLNLRYAIRDDMVMHFAAARVMARPTFGEVAPRLNISEANQRVAGGNPFLKPFVSDQLDLAFAYYMGNSGMVSIGLFYKDITDFIQKTTVVDIYPDPEGGGCLMVGGDVDENGCSLFEITTPQNGENAEVRGVELIVQRDFDFLPGIWGNFGVAANYTYNDSEVGILNPDTGVAITNELTLPGLSEDTFNATLYYEDERLDMRLSRNYRSDYLVAAFAGQNNTNFTHDYMQLDFSAGYYITDNIKLTLQAQNLTNEKKWGYAGWKPYWPQSGDKTRTKFAIYDGAKYRLGLTANF